MSIPDGKDIEGVHAALEGRPIESCSVSTPTLTYDSRVLGKPTPIDTLTLSQDGELVLALGTWSFISVLAERLGLETEPLVILL